ncbi:hypothetical protein TWF106_010898 [Orbilia oligospora]|uniref:Uncharacterized protein n=1 Tax=Orbilia oligospora TaxID=2813651 RepID=A0A6G1M5E9_ORBOL|nr:hypothetical protein TWF788_010486 [Orbilia oligospora]KAF3209664.1 hypothetical protein TWF106_010898 [Orbilia oligospora]KAF3221234.1 hypothetical protein TWF191_007200 [Orbilia oligospora]KAF3246129.1 hypothetical protein TWF192_006977 [Orbilia oligospora]
MHVKTQDSNPITNQGRFWRFECKEGGKDGGREGIEVEVYYSNQGKNPLSFINEIQAPWYGTVRRPIFLADCNSQLIIIQLHNPTSWDQAFQLTISLLHISVACMQEGGIDRTRPFCW